MKFKTFVASSAVIALAGIMFVDLAEARGKGPAGGARTGAAATSIQGNVSGNDRINNSGNKINNGNNKINNGNINIGNEVNIDVDRGWDNDIDIDHPVAVGVAIGTTATAIAVGARYYTLPPNCPIYPYTTLYYYCGGYYYQPVYYGTSVQYVVVVKPN